MPKRVFITAAEVSGDAHAAALIESLRKLDSAIEIEGHGGPKMVAAGCKLHTDTVTNAAMGLAGALRYFEMRKLWKWTADYMLNRPFDLQIGVDSPDMNTHFARIAKRVGTPVLQYVAPQTWAWREYRLKKLRQQLDQIACILPFEEDYFRKHGVHATFVGHPLFDELPPHRQLNRPPLTADRAPVVGLLPGSRRSEARGNFPPMLEVARKIQGAFPKARFIVPTTPATHPEVIRIAEANPIGSLLVHHTDAMPDARGTLTVKQDAFDELVPQCDLCITASGTATLHVASHGVPMIVVYRGSPILWHGLGRWLVKIDNFSLVNLLAGVEKDRRIVPEFIPWFGEIPPVADCAIDYLKNPDRLEAQHQNLDALVKKLDRPGASMNVAKMAMGMMK